MLIEQIFGFELRGPGPPSRRLKCTPATDYFCDKTKISKKNVRVDYYLLLQYCTSQCILLSPTWAKLQNLTLKCKILNVFWT